MVLRLVGWRGASLANEGCDPVAAWLLACSHDQHTQMSHETRLSSNTVPRF